MIEAVRSASKTIDIDNVSSLGYLRPVDYYRGNPEALKEARRVKMAQARHRRKEINLGLKQKTLPWVT